MQELEIEKLLDKYPEISPSTLEEAQALGEELDRLDIGAAPRRLAAPHERRRARVIDARHVTRLSRR